MANILTLVGTVNNLYPCNESSNKLNQCDSVDALARKRINEKKKKCGNYDYLSGFGARVSGVGRTWRLCAATELRVVQETYNRNINVQNPVALIEIPVTCYQVTVPVYLFF